MRLQIDRINNGAKKIKHVHVLCVCVCERESDEQQPNLAAQIGYFNKVHQIHRIRARGPAALFVAGIIEIRCASSCVPS